MSRFLLSAACLSLAPLAQAANWIPTSPLVQIGDDLDIFFDGSVGFELTDNLYSAAKKSSAASVTLTPGLLLEYGKESPIEFTLSARRGYVYFLQSKYSDLEDARDALSAKLAFASGGPLELTFESTYRVTARNDELASQGVSGAILGATLLRQSNYKHSVQSEYKLTERIRLGAGFSYAYNNYLNPVLIGPALGKTYNTNTLTEITTKSIPVSLNYRVFEKLTFGFSYQHDVSDYGAAPYYSEVGNPRPELADNSLTQDFYGLSAKGQLTESGKLNILGRAGYSTFNRDKTGSGSAPSYAVTLSHSLSDFITHSLVLSRQISASSTGTANDSRNCGYNVQYAAAEDLDFNLGVTKGDVIAGATKVHTWTYTLGADFKYNKHLSFQAGYNFTDSKVPGNSSVDFQANSLTVSTSFRY